MCREEIMNKEDRKAWKAMGKQAESIHKALQGQLSCTTDEWIRCNSKKNLS